jgi:hypothetical protein
MAENCHNTPGLTTKDCARLIEYVGERQTEAAQLTAVLEAAELLSNHNIDQSALRSLVNVALAMAATLNERLDYINLPEGGAA